jgi:hypothetical protein
MHEGMFPSAPADDEDARARRRLSH